MTSEQEIERMAKIFCFYKDWHCPDCKEKKICEFKIRAKELQDAGIGDKKQAIKEFINAYEKRIEGTSIEDNVGTLIMYQLFTELYIEK